MEWLFTNLALALDTLPPEGRLVLLALLLSVALAGFARSLPRTESKGVNLLYRKAALVALPLVPLAIYAFGIRLPVTVDEVTAVTTTTPTIVTWVVVAIWFAGFLLSAVRLGRRVRNTQSALLEGAAASKIEARMRHWQQRLNIPGELTLRVADAELPWHIGGIPRWVEPGVHLPASALNWPVGVVDVMLLGQLALLKQKAWRWLLFGRLVQAVFWPAPWVARLVDDFARFLVNPAERLAQAAFRDPEGWQRDHRKFAQRADMLAPVEIRDAGCLRLPSAGVTEAEEEKPRSASFEERVKNARRRRREVVRDPHERAYWLVAAASVLVATATTLTRVPTPPEPDFTPLLQQWEITMFRTVGEYGEDGEDAKEDDAGAPRQRSD